MGWAFIFTGPILFLVGLMITLTSTGAMTSVMPERRAGGLQTLPVGLALVATGIGLTAVGARQEQRRREQRQRQKERDRLYRIFLQLLKEHEGNLTVLQFAVATELDIYAARAYLDEQAKALNAAYNITQEGKFSYYFDLEGASLEALPSGDQWG